MVVFAIPALARAHNHHVLEAIRLDLGQGQSAARREATVVAHVPIDHGGGHEHRQGGGSAHHDRQAIERTHVLFGEVQIFSRVAVDREDAALRRVLLEGGEIEGDHAAGLARLLIDVLGVEGALATQESAQVARARVVHELRERNGSAPGVA